MRLKDPKAFDYDYNGSCSPTGRNFGQNTFSVGVFQWVPKNSGKGLKRTKAIKRIKGYISNPQDVYDRAEAYCQFLERVRNGEGDGR